MSSKPLVLAVIPARSGSKSIRDKNIRVVGGKPLIAWSIEQALQSKHVGRTIVSTDSEQYAEIARQYGAETPFLRPKEIAGDEATDLEVFLHALLWLKEHEGYVPELCVHLRPTCPVRKAGAIDELVQILQERPDLDSVRTVTEVLHPPFKMWYRSENGLLSPVAPLPHVKDPWNEPRQRLPQTYIQTANIDVVRASVITGKRSMTGDRIYGYVETGFFDIDTEAELEKVATAMQPAVAQRPTPAPSGSCVGSSQRKTYCFDIDGVIATLTENNDYSKAKPRAEMIDRINRLHTAGHQIILFTARGSATGIDWRSLTEEQMQQWGVRYHKLVFGKPAADFYFDDRMMSLEDLDVHLGNNPGHNEANSL